MKKQQMTHPSDGRPVRDFIVPICNLDIRQGGHIEWEQSKLAGTSFLIGKRGYGITAAHVVDQTEDQFRYALVAFGDEQRTRWRAIKIIQCEIHPEEDVAILKFGEFPDGVRVSYLSIPGDKEFASLEYSMWAYPEIIAKEVEYHGEPAGAFQPDLVFFKGYVRRRMPFSPNPSFDAYKGSVFYELSEIGGSCCSGAPLINHRGNVWKVFGIYVGDETTGRKCGYGVSLESIADWSPRCLGCTVRDEAAETAIL